MEEYKVPIHVYELQESAKRYLNKNYKQIYDKYKDIIFDKLPELAIKLSKLKKYRCSIPIDTEDAVPMLTVFNNSHIKDWQKLLPQGITIKSHYISENNLLEFNW